MNPLELELRWNLFNVDGSITIQSTEHQVRLIDRFVSLTSRVEIVRSETQLITITGPNWQIIGTLVFHKIIASAELYPRRDQEEEESFEFRLDHVGTDCLVKLLQYLPNFGNIRIIGRIRQYEGLIKGRNWAFVFKVWVQTPFLDISERLPFIVPAPLLGSPLMLQNSFIATESRGPLEAFMYNHWIRTGELPILDLGEESSESD